MTIRLKKPKRISGAFRQVGEILSLPASAELELTLSGVAESLPVNGDYAFGSTGVPNGFVDANNNYFSARMTGATGISGMQKQPYAEFKPSASSGTTAAAQMSRHSAYILEGVKFSACKVRLWNAHSVAVDYIASTLTSSAVEDGLYNASTWTTLTTGGSGTFSVPAYANGTMGFLDSDIMDMTSATYGNGTIWAVRTYCALGNSTRLFTPAASSQDLAAGRFISANKTGVDIVTNPTSLAPTITYPVHLAPASLIWWPENSVTRLTLFSGSSQLRGGEDPLQLGFLSRACGALSTANRAYVLTSNGLDTQTSEEGITALQNALANQSLVCDHLFWPMSITDDVGLAIFGKPAYVQYTLSNLYRVIEICNRYGIQVHAVSNPIATGTSDLAYTTRLATYAAAEAAAATGVCGYFRMFETLQDSTATTATWRDSTWTTDGLHPNGVGVIPITEYAKQYISALPVRN